MRFLSTNTAAATQRLLKIGILLQRSPMLIKEMNEFENNYLLFKENELENERKDFKNNIGFYYKKGSLNEQRFWEAQNDAKKLGAVDENRVVQPLEPEIQEWINQQQLIPAATANNDSLTSLDRHPTEPLYLFIRRVLKKNTMAANDAKESGWRLPESSIDDKLALHETAPKALESVIGKKNDVWFVGQIPVGMIKNDHENATTFFMKAHIFAGKVEAGGEYEHAWFTRQECEKELDPHYYSKVADMI